MFAELPRTLEALMKKGVVDVCEIVNVISGHFPLTPKLFAAGYNAMDRGKVVSYLGVGLRTFRVQLRII